MERAGNDSACADAEIADGWTTTWETMKSAGDFPDSGLRGAAGFIPGSLGVQAILQDVEVKRAEVHDAIIVDGVVDAVKFVIRIPFAAFFDELGGAVEHPAIEFFELIVRKRVARRIEIAEITQGEAEGVANLAVRFAELRHDPLAHFHVGLVFDRGGPQAKQIGAPFFA